ELREIYERIFKHSVLLDEILHLRRLLDLDLNQDLDAELFVVVSCVMERIIVRSKGLQSPNENKRNLFEMADFCSLNGKLHGINISPQLRSLLYSRFVVGLYTQVCGFDPGPSRWIFMMQKIVSIHAV
ncbi:UNVERIFIED_CONTAM: hypothetical protein NCL1_39096, partial [Trichonephila clavipes]